MANWTSRERIFGRKADVIPRNCQRSLVSSLRFRDLRAFDRLRLRVYSCYAGIHHKRKLQALFTAPRSSSTSEASSCGTCAGSEFGIWLRLRCRSRRRRSWWRNSSRINDWWPGTMDPAMAGLSLLSCYWLLAAEFVDLVHFVVPSCWNLVQLGITTGRSSLKAEKLMMCFVSASPLQWGLGPIFPASSCTPAICAGRARFHLRLLSPLFGAFLPRFALFT